MIPTLSNLNTNYIHTYSSEWWLKYLIREFVGYAATSGWVVSHVLQYRYNRVKDTNTDVIIIFVSLRSIYLTVGSKL